MLLSCFLSYCPIYYMIIKVGQAVSRCRSFHPCVCRMSGPLCVQCLWVSGALLPPSLSVIQTHCSSITKHQPRPLLPLPPGETLRNPSLTADLSLDRLHGPGGEYTGPRALKLAPDPAKKGLRS